MFALVAAIATENENYKPYHDIISFRRLAAIACYTLFKSQQILKHQILLPASW